jgi:pantothenate kinase
MDMLKRMQKSNILPNETPLLGLDIGGITVKLAFFDTDENTENRILLKKFFNKNLTEYLVNKNVNTEMKIKNLVGNVRLYLLTREVFSGKVLKQLIELKLQQPFICVTGAALVNYLNILNDDIKARVLILSSENEAVVRGVRLLQTQNVSSFHQIQFNVDNESEVVYNIGLLNENFYPATLAVIGTSTAFIRLNAPNSYSFLNSSAISGQTFVGLCNVASKIGGDSSLNFSDCLKLASNGSNEELDVTVKKLCGGSENKVEQFLYLHNLETGLYSRKDDFIRKFGDLSISCFGDENKVVSLDDVASSAMNLVCYQTAEMLCLYSRLNPNNRHILCSGSFLVDNMQAKYLITKYVHVMNRGRNVKSQCNDVFFIDNEACLAALGCLAIDEKNVQVEPQD